MYKILIVTYYWPPDTGGGVQRILKFCKFLKAFGHEPVVITTPARPGPFADTSFSLDTAGIRSYRVAQMFDPVKVYNRINKNSGSEISVVRPGALRRLTNLVSDFIWLNLFIPDSKIGWYQPVLGRIDAILKREHYDALITTGPPYTAHLIGLSLKRRYKLPWIVDIRDPWPHVSYKIVPRFKLVKDLNRFLEKRVLNSADKVITVGRQLAELLEGKVRRGKISVIYNGFDEKDFPEIQEKKAPVFRLGYYGRIHKQQIPYALLRQLADEIKHSPGFAKQFRLEIFGEISAEVLWIIQSILPGPNLKVSGNIPHGDLQKEFCRPQAFLLLINDFPGNNLIITGKIFEYLHCGWPVLGIGPVGGEAAQILAQTHAGKMFAHMDSENPINWLREVFDRWEQGRLQRNPVGAPLYRRKNQARQLESVITDLLSKGKSACTTRRVKRPC